MAYMYIALPPICFVGLTKDKTKIESRMGMGYGIIAFNFLAGGRGGVYILGEADPLNWKGFGYLFWFVLLCVGPDVRWAEIG